ncbi:MAG: nitrilase-related carbon-nitrogen hydrolase, partial [Gaiellaceae bacterium]
MRIAVASTPLTTTLAEAVPAAVAAVEEAGRHGAAIVCLPETGLPGHRGHGDVTEVTMGELEQAVEEVAVAAARARVVTVVGAERHTPAGREIVSHVIAADGALLGTQAKTQIDPDEEAWYVAGCGRRIFHAAGLTFGVAICHEAFRYPEISRSLALGGA